MAAQSAYIPAEGLNSRKSPVAQNDWAQFAGQDAIDEDDEHRQHYDIQVLNSKSGFVSASQPDLRKN